MLTHIHRLKPFGVCVREICMSMFSLKVGAMVENCCVCVRVFIFKKRQIGRESFVCVISLMHTQVWGMQPGVGVYKHTCAQICTSAYSTHSHTQLVRNILEASFAALHSTHWNIGCCACWCGQMLQSCPTTSWRKLMTESSLTWHSAKERFRWIDEATNYHSCNHDNSFF